MDATRNIIESHSDTPQSRDRYEQRNDVRRANSGISSICTVCPAHILEVFDIANLIYHETEAFSVPTFAAQLREEDAIQKIGRYLTANDAALFTYQNIDVAYQNRAIVGCIGSFELAADTVDEMAREFAPSAAFFAEIQRTSKKSWHIGFFATDQVTCRADIASELIQDVRNQARNKGFDQLSVFVRGKSVAHDAFEREGFTEPALSSRSTSNIQQLTNDWILLVNPIESMPHKQGNPS